MPRRSRERPDWQWPSWRYGPNGEAAIFKCPADVPPGWTKKPGDQPEPFEPRPVLRLDRAELIRQLNERGIAVHGTWSSAYMKELLEHGVNKP